MFDSIRELIGRSDRKLLAATVILGCLIIFAAAKMAGAVSGDAKRSPDYRSQPSQAFAPASADTIVEKKYLDQQHIPDDDFNEISAIAEAVAKPIAGLTVNENQLVSVGMSRQSARVTISKLKELSPALTGRSVSVNQNFSIDGVSVVDSSISASLVISVQYGTSSDNGPGTAGQLHISAIRPDLKSWKVTDITLTLDDGGSF